MVKRLVPLTVFFFAAACVSGEEQPASEEGTTETEATVSAAEGPPPVSGDTVTTESGLQYIEVQAGSGTAADPGDVVSVHYTGWFTDGRKFDSSLDRGQPFGFPLGQGRVIPGWDEAVALMRVGDRRRLIIPPELAYGERGHPAGIPPNSTLIFDVELMAVESPGGA